MAFIILGSVGSAIGAGLTAAGLGTIGGAVSGAAGALSGALGSGLTAAGLAGAGEAATAAGTALGSVGAGAGTAIGAPVGAVAQGIGSLMGAGGAGGAGSAAGGAAPSAVLGGSAQAVGAEGALASVSPEALAGAVPASQGVGISGGVVTAPGAGGTLSSAALPSAGSVFGTGAPSLASEAGSFMGDQLLEEGANQALAPKEQARPPERIAAGRPRSPYSFGGGSGSPLSNPFAGFAEGGLTTLKGGGIAMRDGQYVIPADVVSAIGNGSSKAGAKFLEAAFNHYIQNGPPEGLQAPQRAGSLAEQRAIERMNRKPV